MKASVILAHKIKKMPIQTMTLYISQAFLYCEHLIDVHAKTEIILEDEKLSNI